MSRPPQGDRSGGSDEPDFDWLYGTRQKGVGSRPSGSSGGARPGQDPEPTRVLPTMGRPGREDPRRAAPPPGRDRPREQDPARGPRGPVEPPRTGGGPSGPARPPRSRRGFRWGWLKLALVLWLVFLVAVPFWAWAKVEKVQADPGGDRPPDQPGTTYLLVGSDSREGLSRKEQLDLGTGKGEGRRTDTIMLLHTGDGPNLLMSVPRDSLVDVPGYGTTKINAAFAYGGPRLLVKTLENATGIRIDDYIEIGFAGFVDVVDAVGGVQICPKQAMKDPQANLDIEKGCQEADGKVALGYARSRHTSGLGDIDRARHQREVVSAVGAEAVSPWSLLNPVRYVRLAAAGSDSLRVGKDTSLLATLKFAWAMTRVDGESGLTCGVPIADLAVNWDQDRAEKLFKLIAEDRTDEVGKDLCRPSGLRGQ
ncbi:LCP family protein [Nocardioides mesophilus]|uniref:LCP family protein n=1 Tax=Nocardioides mesophilus TaxID=433659 RepID=A0A7G9RDG7_9ACTN|nr:LCP family protein [Nocardioides mesophilus]QNN53642.1 LCP family protein [Nocardioides mesophilus]